MAQVPAYPEVLKDAAWQKTKGIIAKITAPPTKLGEFTRSTQAAYAAVKWGTAFGVPADVSSKLADVAQQQMDAAGIYKTQIKNLQDELVELKKQAIAVRTQWGPNKAILKPQKEHVAKMVLACDALSTEIEDGWKAALAEFELLKKKIAFRDPAQARDAAVASDVLVTKTKAADKPEVKLKFKTPAAPPPPAKSAAPGTAAPGIPSAPPSPAAKGPSSGAAKAPASSASKSASSGAPAAPPSPAPGSPSASAPKPPTSSAGRAAASGAPAAPPSPPPGSPSTSAPKAPASSGGRAATSGAPVPPPRPPAAKGPTSAAPKAPGAPAGRRP